MADIRIYDSDDKVVKDLIETNLRQRGDISSSSLKMGRIICELERIYGIRQGSAGKVGLESTLSTPKQSEIADKLGMDKNTYRNYKKLTTLIPELQEMVDSDQIITSVASRILARLSPTDQQQLILTYGKQEIEKATQAKAQEMVDEITLKRNGI